MERNRRTRRQQRFALSPMATVVAVVLGIAGVVLAAQAVQAMPNIASAIPLGPFQPASAPTPYANSAVGIPAVHPRAAVAQQAGGHFTEADVRQYVASHRPAFAVVGTPNPAVTSVQFLTAGEASALLQGEAIGVPDATLVCLVRLSGTFQNTYAPPGVVTKPFNQGVLIFDATTGNLLVSSVG
jgi:hypothetical protein